MRHCITCLLACTKSRLILLVAQRALRAWRFQSLQASRWFDLQQESLLCSMNAWFSILPVYMLVCMYFDLAWPCNGMLRFVYRCVYHARPHLHIENTNEIEMCENTHHCPFFESLGSFSASAKCERWVLVEWAIYRRWERVLQSSRRTNTALSKLSVIPWFSISWYNARLLMLGEGSLSRASLFRSSSTRLRNHIRGMLAYISSPFWDKPSQGILEVLKADLATLVLVHWFTNHQDVCVLHSCLQKLKYVLVLCKNTFVIFLHI